MIMTDSVVLVLGEVNFGSLYAEVIIEEWQIATPGLVVTEVLSLNC